MAVFGKPRAQAQTLSNFWSHETVTPEGTEKVEAAGEVDAVYLV